MNIDLDLFCRFLTLLPCSSKISQTYAYSFSILWKSYRMRIVYAYLFHKEKRLCARLSLQYVILDKHDIYCIKWTFWAFSCGFHTTFLSGQKVFWLNKQVYKSSVQDREASLWQANFLTMNKYVWIHDRSCKSFEKRV